ncbi:hypothetical protein EYF80_056473 [Liparis tanakae]|uniref:Uncharacterized protein n=1 Tax=Liparis tanakae TaxID=230148 RepID=A0A4Z2EYE7_9TELE|nr:hypothetical protein EYF80_056473 [Liparis tanakae]
MQETGCGAVGGLIIGLSLWEWVPFFVFHPFFYLQDLRARGAEGGAALVQGQYLDLSTWTCRPFQRGQRSAKSRGHKLMKLPKHDPDNASFP